jgi:hypothetical protein
VDHEGLNTRRLESEVMECGFRVEGRRKHKLVRFFRCTPQNS